MVSAQQKARLLSQPDLHQVATMWQVGSCCPVWSRERGARYGERLLLFKDGEVVERITGYPPKPKFLAKLEPHLN
jgi:hypothetical protein